MISRVGLKEELVQLEREKLDLDSERCGLSHSLQLAETARGKLEEAIRRLQQEKQEVSEQLSLSNRQKAVVSDELMQVDCRSTICCFCVQFQIGIHENS